jgi:hypothetical protein
VPRRARASSSRHRTAGFRSKCTRCCRSSTGSRGPARPPAPVRRRPRPAFCEGRRRARSLTASV